MKIININLIIFILFGCTVAMAQPPNITELEYYFDIDPGFGNGISVAVTPGPNTTTAFNLDISGLSAGIHYAYIRAKDADKVWSLVHKMIVHKIEDPPLSLHKDIINLEYFYDIDPGFGNGTPVTIVSDTVTNTTSDIDISGLSAGYHKVYFRAKDEDRCWSLNYVQNILKVEAGVIPPSTNIIAMEYFIDTDPGFGNATPVTIIDGTSTNTAFSIDISGLDAGYHKVYFRTKNENRVWSLAYIQNLVKVSIDPFLDSPDLVELEYFVDTDPGFGNGKPLVLSPDPTMDLTFSADLTGVTAGDHDLYIRIKDEDLNWSLISVYPFEVAEIELTAYLEGAFNGSTMDTDLNENLPLSQPFNASPWNYTGTESVVAIPNANIVDWVLLETRNAEEASLATESTRSSRYAAFMLNDGSIVDLDGSSSLNFNAHAVNNNYVLIHHRNHLGVLSSQELNYSAGIFDYNFSSGLGQAYNAGHKLLGSGVYGLIGGNANSDGIVDEFDLSDRWDLEAGETGYHNGDMNMDTEVDNEDKNELWLQNLGSSSTIPE